MRIPLGGATRRSLLSSVLVGESALLSGCLGATGGGRDAPPEGATAAVEVASVGSLGPAIPVAAMVDVAYPWATADRPPAIEVALENESRRRLFVVAGDGDWQVLSDRASDQLRPGVALVGDDAGRSPPSERPPDGCWKLADGTANPLRVRNLTELGPGETRSMRFEVWGDHRNAAGVCLPVGEFAFSESYAVESDPEATASDWTFSLRVEAVG